MEARSVCRLLILVAQLLPLCLSHGRLVSPPGRSTAWRYKFDTPVNYNDHELYCGGYSKQWVTNKGKCGPCGDSYEQKTPRANENGGKFGVGVIVGDYRKGQMVELGIQLTANHKGYFEFRICPHNSLGKPIPEQDSCFQKYILQKANGSGPRFAVESGRNDFVVEYLLPEGLTCSQCVIQWRYVAGNNWGKCSDGTGKVGCGAQEEFRSCSDVRIHDDLGHADDTPNRPATTTTDDYNEIEDDYTYIPKLEPGMHSYGGHIGAVLSAVFLVLILLILLLMSYMWQKGRFTTFFSSTKNKWSSQFNAPDISAGTKKITTILPTVNPPIPVAPPRRHHKTNQQVPRLSPINISNPVNVLINGVPVASTQSQTS